MSRSLGNSLREKRLSTMPVIGRSGWERSSKPASTVELSDSTNSWTFSEVASTSSTGTASGAYAPVSPGDGKVLG